MEKTKRTRAQIKRDVKKRITSIKKLKDDIKALEGEILNLNREDVLLSDKNQWFTEEMEDWTTRVNRKKVVTKRLVGRIHWIEGFKDEDSGQIIKIQRQEIVRVDKDWNW